MWPPGFALYSPVPPIAQSKICTNFTQRISIETSPNFVYYAVLYCVIFYGQKGIRFINWLTYEAARIYFKAYYLLFLRDRLDLLNRFCKFAKMMIFIEGPFCWHRVNMIESVSLYRTSSTSTFARYFPYLSLLRYPQHVVCNMGRYTNRWVAFTMRCDHPRYQMLKT